MGHLSSQFAPDEEEPDDLTLPNRSLPRLRLRGRKGYNASRSTWRPRIAVRMGNRTFLGRPLRGTMRREVE